MNNSQASTSTNGNNLILVLDEKDVSFLLKLDEKSDDIFPVGKKKLKKYIKI